MLGQRDREQVHVTAFVFRRVVAADDGIAMRRQRGLDGDDLVGRHHAALDAEVAHQPGGALGIFEFLRIAIEIQDAALKMVVLDAQVGAHGAQRGAAVFSHADHGADVGRQPAGQALAQERQAPHPLAPVELRAEQQRRVFLEHPLQQLERRLGIGPGFGVGHRDLRAVGQAGFWAGPVQRSITTTSWPAWLSHQALEIPMMPLPNTATFMPALLHARSLASDPMSARRSRPLPK